MTIISAISCKVAVIYGDMPTGHAAAVLGVTEVTAGPTAGSNAAVLQDGAEMRGCTGAGLSGGERLHGGEDQGETVRHVLVWGASKSRCVA